MMRFDIITIFPEAVEPYVNASILARAQAKRLVKIGVHDLRRWTRDKHRTVDDAPYGGGPGMIMKVEPIYRSVKSLKGSKVPGWAGKGPRPGRQRSGVRVLLTSASGRQFDQQRAKYYANRYDHLVLICGRYEGVDARVTKYIADEEVSVGPYVLTGGELPALTVVDAVTRLVPGVIRAESLEEESFSFDARAHARHVLGPQSGNRVERAGQIGEYPQYTRPEVFYPEQRRGVSPKRGVSWKVPKVLLSGDHKRIAEWRAGHTKALLR